MHNLSIVHETRASNDVVIQSDTKIVFVCGEGSITITPDGKITLRGTSIHEVAENLKIEVERMDISCK